MAEVPTVGEMKAGGFDQLPLGPDAFEEHDELQLEENDGVNGGPSPLRVEILGPVPDEAEVELGLQMTVEVVLGNNGLERDGDRLVESAGLRGAQHGPLLG